jgi:hypothetical protein
VAAGARIVPHGPISGRALPWGDPRFFVVNFTEDCLVQNYWLVVTTQKQRYEELAHEAQIERLVRTARREQVTDTNMLHRKGLRRRTLNWVGCRMVTWGLRLQGNQERIAQLTTC